MADNIVRREVQRRDDPFGIPACFYWTIDEVADWIESIGYAKYKENFRSHFINGRKLLTVDACVLPKMGITHFGDILDLAKIIQCLSHSRVPVTSSLRPGPRPPAISLRDEVAAASRVVPWWQQRRHLTFVDYTQNISRIQAARLANQRQYYMAP